MSLYYEVLIQISLGYPSVKGRLHTRYAPVRRSLNPKTYTPRLACVKPAASVHPEPGSNSSSYILILYSRCFFYRFFSNLSILLLLFYLFWNLFQNGCQFNMSTNVYSFVSPVSQSGCKTKKLIFNWQMFFEVFFRKFLFFLTSFICQSLNELSLFCGVQM